MADVDVDDKVHDSFISEAFVAGKLLLAVDPNNISTWTKLNLRPPPLPIIIPPPPGSQAPEIPSQPRHRTCAAVAAGQADRFPGGRAPRPHR